MAEPGRTAVAITGLTHQYPGAPRPVLNVEHLHIAAGETVALIGTSGAGKSTLLRLIDDRLRGWSGEVRVGDNRLGPAAPLGRTERRATGFIFQEFALIEQATVTRNVMNGRLGHQPPLASVFGRQSPVDRTRVAEAIASVDLSDLAHRRAERLSGGQRQRVAIARCLAQQPDIILADEPVASLDPVNAASVLKLLRDTAATRGATLILSSHQPDLVADYVDRFIALDEGRIVHDGPSAEFDTSHHAAVYGNGDAATPETRP